MRIDEWRDRVPQPGPSIRVVDLFSQHAWHRRASSTAPALTDAPRHLYITQWIEEALAFFLRVEYAPVRWQFTQDAGIVVSGFVPVPLPNSRVVALNVEQLGAAANDTPVGAAFPLPRNAGGSSIVHRR